MDDGYGTFLNDKVRYRSVITQIIQVFKILYSLPMRIDQLSEI